MSTPINSIPQDSRSSGEEEDQRNIQAILQEFKAQENPNSGGMDMPPPGFQPSPDDMSGYQPSQYRDMPPPENEIEYIEEAPPRDSYYRGESGPPVAGSKNLVKNKTLLEKIWQELKTPLLVLALYILFGLRVFDKTLMRYIPRMANDVGHISVMGLILKGILLALIFFLVKKFI